MTFIKVENNGLIAVEHIVAVGLVEAAPVKRLVGATEQTLVLTGGKKRQTAVLLDSGQLVITALSLAEITDLLVRPLPQTDD